MLPDKTPQEDEMARKILVEFAKQEVNKPSGNFNKAIQVFSDKLNLAKQFFEIQPVYYDTERNWWLWDSKSYRWERVDETQLLILVGQNSFANTISSKDKSEIVEGLKQVGRMNKPLDPKHTWVQFQGLILDLETGETFSASSKYFISNPIPWKLGDGEDTPELDKLLIEWVGQDRLLTAKEIMASCCLTFMPLHRIFCLIGKGRNGKGKFVELIIKLIGKENATATELNKLLSSRFEISKLYKKLMLEIGEIDKAVFKQTAMLKALSGEDTLGGEFKHKDSFDFISYAKPIIKTNVLPETTDTSDGFWSRWCILDFPNQFKEGKSPVERITNSEFSNFCRQIPKLIKDLQERGHYWMEGDIQARKENYQSHSSPMDPFLETFCTLDINQEIKFSDFYDKYSNFLETNGHKGISKLALTKILNIRGLRSLFKTQTNFGIHTSSTFIQGINWK